MVAAAIVTLVAVSTFAAAPLITGPTAHADALPSNLEVHASVVTLPLAMDAGTPIAVSVTSTRAREALIDVEIYDAANKRVLQAFYEDVPFSAGQTHDFVVLFKAAPGVYTVKIGVFEPDWVRLLAWNDDAASLVVGPSGPRGLGAIPDTGGVATVSAAGLIWPARGPITSHFGPAHPLGIDVAVVSRPIVAVAAGRVVFTGGDPCCSYGYNVVIKHERDLETRYAHLAAFAVSAGQWVEQGQVLGMSGNTGRSSGPHLHFELFKKGVAQDPLRYLP